MKEKIKRQLQKLNGDTRLLKKTNSTDIINVLFLAQYIPAWNKFENIYKIMLDDDKFNPCVICIPDGINDEEVKTNRKNDTFEYFIAQGYDAINAIDENGQWIDLQQLSPHYVFYTRPYNDLLPEPYKSINVSKYTSICLIMYGMNMIKGNCSTTLNIDFTKDLKYFFAECEYLRTLFIKKYPISTRLGIRKVYNSGSTGLEQVLLDKDKKTDEWEFHNGNLRVIWAPRWTTDPETGGSSFFVYYKDIIEYAKKHQDITLLCRPHPLMFDNFVKTGEMSQEEVDEYKELINKTENVKLNETKEYDAILWNSDVLISDLSSLMPEYFVTGKPIIYCTPSIELPMSPHSEKMLEGCYLANTKEEMFSYLEQLRLGNDPLKECRPRIIKEAFGENIDKTSKGIVEILKNGR